VEKAERAHRAEMIERSRSLHHLIASLAAERFEFGRLMQRIAPELERRGCRDLQESFVLFVRAWDLKMSRAGIHVHDLAGAILTDELAGDVEVESHVPDPFVGQTTVRETLIPLVLLDGKAIAPAKVVTSVPVTPKESGK
jgi:hypothetical protein